MSGLRVYGSEFTIVGRLHDGHGEIKRERVKERESERPKERVGVCVCERKREI